MTDKKEDCLKVEALIHTLMNVHSEQNIQKMLLRHGYAGEFLNWVGVHYGFMHYTNQHVYVSFKTHKPVPIATVKNDLKDWSHSYIERHVPSHLERFAEFTVKETKMMGKHLHRFLTVP